MIKTTNEFIRAIFNPNTMEGIDHYGIIIDNYWSDNIKVTHNRYGYSSTICTLEVSRPKNWDYTCRLDTQQDEVKVLKGSFILKKDESEGAKITFDEIIKRINHVCDFFEDDNGTTPTYDLMSDYKN